MRCGTPIITLISRLKALLSARARKSGLCRWMCETEFEHQHITSASIAPAASDAPVPPFATAAASSAHSPTNCSTTMATQSASLRL